MPTPAKAAEIDVLTEKLSRSKSAVLLHTEGLTVAEMMDMRRRLATSEIEVHVVKNTLLRIAAERAQYQDLAALLTGQTTLAIGYGDEVAPAKAVSDYLKGAKTAKPVTIKAGILEHAPISVKEVEDLSKIPPRNELQARVVGTIQGPLSHTYSIISAPTREFIYTIEARVRQLEGPGEAA